MLKGISPVSPLGRPPAITARRPEPTIGHERELTTEQRQGQCDRRLTPGSSHQPPSRGHHQVQRLPGRSEQPTRRCEEGLGQAFAQFRYRGAVNAEPTKAAPKQAATNPTSASASRVAAPRLWYLASYNLSSSLSAGARATTPFRAAAAPRSSRRVAKASSGVLGLVWCDLVRPSRDRVFLGLFYLLADGLRRVRQRPFERAAILYLVSATHLPRISDGGFDFLFRNK